MLGGGGYQRIEEQEGDMGRDSEKRRASRATGGQEARKGRQAKGRKRRSVILTCVNSIPIGNASARTKDRAGKRIDGPPGY